MRIRLPIVLTRGDPQQGATSRDTSAGGPGGENGDADVEAKHAPVRDGEDTRPWPRFRRARTAGEWCRAVFSWAAARGRRIAARGRRLAGPRPEVTGWAFAAVTQAPALLAMAWLVPGIGMLL
ncbi:MAG TPA: hypothetical protein VH594_16935, partial [Trebonia sp.]